MFTGGTIGIPFWLVGAPPILVYLSGDWDVHWGYDGAPPILVYLSGDWDVHWGYDLDFDPWPYSSIFVQKQTWNLSSLHVAAVSLQPTHWKDRSRQIPRGEP